MIAGMRRLPTHAPASAGAPTKERTCDPQSPLSVERCSLVPCRSLDVAYSEMRLAAQSYIEGVDCLEHHRNRARLGAEAQGKAYASPWRCGEMSVRMLRLGEGFEMMPRRFYV
jgi:hypothetical protein